MPLGQDDALDAFVVDGEAQRHSDVHFWAGHAELEKLVIEQIQRHKL